ncbi:S-layer homology domain-containing protein [Paenibacillus sp. VT-400]|uniref:S-layer homology domain-containing protein n=1 Tax=Paenibacillus sp. VT-400 TaxID=1495853 RepID=UPI000A605401|nr:S-layer homology domain-containing protein [Paenibacillus sp. VT-400]
MKKWGSLFLSGVLLFSGMATSVQAEVTKDGWIGNESSLKTAQQSFKDVEGNWAQEVIEKWADRGIVQGNERNTFLPKGEVTRAEWVAMINRIFQYEEVSNTTFSDVTSSGWYAQDIAKGVQAGYIRGYADHSFRPTGSVTRQEAAATISRILQLQGSGESNFADDKDIQSWSKEAVSGAADKKIIVGYSNGNFMPNKAITRAEAVQILDRAFSTYGSWYGQEGTYGSTEKREEISGSVVIGTSGVTLQNMNITGDLIISKAVGDGDVFLKNVTVQGKTYVYGGGENSVHLEDSVLLTVIVNKQDGTVRLVATGKTKVQEITVQTAANIESDMGAKIDKLTLSEALPEKSRVYLKGNFETVNVVAKSINIQIPSGTINQLNVDDSASGTTVQTNQEAKIISAILNAAVRMLGTGTIEQATVNAVGVTMETAPNKVNLGESVPADTTVQIGGTSKPVTSVTPPVTPAPSASGGSSSGSSEGSGGSATPVNPGTGNGGGTTPTTPLPGNEYGSYEGGSFFLLGVESNTITVTESVYLYSPRSGYAYVTTQNIDGSNLILLEEAVNAGAAMKLPIVANERTEIQTETLITKYGQLRIFVLDSQDKSSQTQYVTVLDGPNQRLVQNGSSMRGSWSDSIETYSIFFNRMIMESELGSLRDHIQVSTNSQTPVFVSLDPEDVVSIRYNEIKIHPKQMNLGKSTYFRILEGAVSTTDSVYRNEVFTSSKFVSFTRPVFVDYPTKSTIQVPVGTVIKFTVNYGGDTAYLVYRDTYGSYANFDKEVTDGHGMKLVIPQRFEGEIFEFDTSDLQPGQFKLSLTSGYTIYVDLK